MSKIAEFFKKALKENQAGYIEMERVKKREQRRQKIESEIAEREKAKEKYRKQFELNSKRNMWNIGSHFKIIAMP